MQCEFWSFSSLYIDMRLASSTFYTAETTDRLVIHSEASQLRLHASLQIRASKSQRWLHMLARPAFAYRRQPSQ